MQNLFLTEEDVFEIKIFVAEDEEGTLYCDLDAEGVKFLLGERESDIAEYTVKFKKPSFGDMMALTDMLFVARDMGDGNMSFDINPIAAKIKTISFLIRDWDFTDDKGNTIPPTEENILNLNPLIATSISVQLEDYLRARSEEENQEKEEQTEKQKEVQDKIE